MSDQDSLITGIVFFAVVGAVKGGGDEVRVEIRVKDTPADHAGAVSMFGKLNRVLRVRAFPGTEPEAIADFRATIPPIQTGVEFRKGSPPAIKLDIPASDRFQALRLISYSESAVRFEIADDGEKPLQRSRREHGPHGELWRRLHVAGIHNREDVREWLDVATPDEAWTKLREVFGVAHMDFVSSEQARAVFDEAGLASVVTMIAQQEIKCREREARLAEAAG